MKSKTLFYLILLTLLTSLSVHAQAFSVIHSFTGGIGGTEPAAGVTIRGNALFGTTYGYPNCGTVYQLTHSGSDWSFSTLAALSHDCNPVSRVVFGPDQHLYGTASGGGTYGGGAVFKLTPQVGPCKDVACYWKVSDLHDFGSGTDGVAPFYVEPVWDQQGNVYGTTSGGGGSPNCEGGCGTVFELTPSGNGYTESVLYSFSGPDGAIPYAGLVFDKNGNLFGTTAGGGTTGSGTVFELTYVPGVGWTEHALYSFQNAVDGSGPRGGVIFDSAGNLYGTVWAGGNGNSGTVFELSPSGNTWTFKLLYSFTGEANCGPAATLSMDGAGNLYGTTQCDGIYGNGSAFKLSNTENGWVYTSLHDFTGGSDGFEPISNVAIDTDGTLFGTTQGGGDFGYGTVWMIKP
jgi:uncharacterized repeat protein (TIGR03803 family)